MVHGTISITQEVLLKTIDEEDVRVERAALPLNEVIETTARGSELACEPCWDWEFRRATSFCCWSIESCRSINYTTDPETGFHMTILREGCWTNSRTSRKTINFIPLAYSMIKKTTLSGERPVTSNFVDSKRKRHIDNTNSWVEITCCLLPFSLRTIGKTLDKGGKGSIRRTWPRTCEYESLRTHQELQNSPMLLSRKPNL